MVTTKSITNETVIFKELNLKSTKLNLPPKNNEYPQIQINNNSFINYKSGHLSGVLINIYKWAIIEKNNLTWSF